MRKRIINAIDWLTGKVGAAASAVMIAVVLIAAYNALARDVGKSLGVRLTTNTLLELQWHLYSFVFLLAAGYALKTGSHVRVDVLYERMSPKVQRLLDLFGLVVLALPFCIVGIVLSWPSVRNSWAILERSSNASGLPLYPVRTLVPLGFALLGLQVIAETLRHFESGEGES